MLENYILANFSIVGLWVVEELRDKKYEELTSMLERF